MPTTITGDATGFNVAATVTTTGPAAGEAPAAAQVNTSAQKACDGLEYFRLHAARTNAANTFAEDQTFQKDLILTKAAPKVSATVGDLEIDAEASHRVIIKPGATINAPALTPGGSATSADAVIVQGNGSACGVSAYAMIRTTNATATTVYTYTVTSNKAISVSIRATAINSAHTLGSVYWIADGVINNGGALAAIGAFPVNVITAQDDIGAGGILTDITGAPNYGIKIVGKMGTTIDWIIQIQIDIVN